MTTRIRLSAIRLAPAASSALLLMLLAGNALAAAGHDAPDKSALTGKTIFAEHCASCHGADGKGDGPKAAGMQPPPADLTKITSRAGGTFPAAHINAIITYGGGIASHTKGAMPIWGKVFSEEGGGGTGGANYSRRAIVGLKRYLETIQQQ